MIETMLLSPGGRTVGIVNESPGTTIGIGNVPAGATIFADAQTGCA